MAKSKEKSSILDLIRSRVDCEANILPPTDIIEAVKTPSLQINRACKGFCSGYMTFVNGMESSGKTTFVLQTIAHNQSTNPDFRALFIDAEHAFNWEYAIALGVDPDRTEVIRTERMEEVFEIIRHSCFDMDSYDKGTIIKNKVKKNYDLIVVDSTDALQVPEDINNEDILKNRMGLRAMAFGAGLRKILPWISQSKTAIVFINQFREKLDGYGDPKVVGGGNAQKYYAYVRLDLRAGAKHKEGDTFVGNEVVFEVFKNKAGTPKGKFTIDLFYGSGFNFGAEVFDIAVQKGVVTKSGSWYSYEDTKLAQGRAAALEVLSDNPELLEEISSKI